MSFEADFDSGKSRHLIKLSSILERKKKSLYVHSNKTYSKHSSIKTNLFKEIVIDE